MWSRDATACCVLSVRFELRSGCLGTLLGGAEARVEAALESTLTVALATTVMPVIVPTVVAVLTAAVLAAIVATVHSTTAVLGCTAVIAVMLATRTESGAERRTETGPEARAESATGAETGAETTAEAGPSAAAEPRHPLALVPAQFAGDGLERRGHRRVVLGAHGARPAHGCRRRSRRDGPVRRVLRR